MLPTWRRLRVAATTFFGLVGAGLLFLAWAAPRSVNGEARAVLGFVGIILPIGFYVVLTVAGWARSSAAGIAPPPIIARLLSWGVAPVLPLGFMFVLIGLFYQLGTALDRPRPETDEASVAADNFNFLNRECLAELGRRARAAGHDPDSADRKPRMAKYCGCLATQLPQQFTPELFNQVLAHKAAADQTQKMDRLTAQCERESNS